MQKAFCYIKVAGRTIYFTDASRVSVITNALKQLRIYLQTVKNAEQFNAHPQIQQLFVDVPEITHKYQANIQNKHVFNNKPTPIAYTII
jgi:hypothetical protein